MTAPCPVPRSLVFTIPSSSTPHLEPFLDQADDAPVADPSFQEPNQLLLADFVEKRLDVGVQYPVHLLALDPDHERIHSIMRAASGPEAIREPVKSMSFVLVDRIEHFDHSPLDNFIFQGRNR